MKTNTVESASYLVIRIDPGRIWRLPQHKQRGLIPEPDDEPAGRVWLRGEVCADVGCALLVLVDGVQLDLVGGARGEVAQLERARVLTDYNVPDALLGLGQRDHLKKYSF